MRNIVFGLLLLGGSITPGFALSLQDWPASFDIKEQSCRMGGCFDLTAQGKKIGSLRLKPNALGTFEFFDDDNQRRITLKLTDLILRPISNQYEFAVYDDNQTVIAKLWMYSDFGIVSFLRFELRSVDEHAKLFAGASDLLSFETTHNVFLGDSSRIVATLSRPLFTLSRDSHVTLNKPAYVLSALDPNLFAAVLALYCTHDVYLSVDPEKVEPPQFVQDLQTKLKKITEEQDVPRAEWIVTTPELEAANMLLHQRYREIYDNTELSEEEKLQQWVDFGCDLVQSHTLSPKEEHAILQVLSHRLES